MSFSNASQEVKDIATRYINEHHQHLANVLIVYLFNAKTIKKGGKELLGEAKLVSGLNAYLATRDLEERPEQLFVITISKSAWDLLEDNLPAREALIDHELRHCSRDLEDGALSINPHDIEEFFDIVRRHGPWMKDIHTFIEAAKNAKTPMLPFDLGFAREQIAKSQEPDSGEEEGDEQKKAAASTNVRHIRRGRGAKAKEDEQEQAASAGE
jgi:hypothetical protein